jgi:hypothetical protein
MVIFANQPLRATVRAMEHVFDLVETRKGDRARRCRVLRRPGERG